MIAAIVVGPESRISRINCVPTASHACGQSQPIPVLTWAYARTEGASYRTGSPFVGTQLRVHTLRTPHQPCTHTNPVAAPEMPGHDAILPVASGYTVAGTHFAPRDTNCVPTQPVASPDLSDRP